jgi:hypothetical protein
MNMDEADMTVAAPLPLPLLVLGDADVDVCADGFCAVPPAQTAQAAQTARSGPEKTGTGE